MASCAEARGGIAVSHAGTGDVRIDVGLAIDLDAFESFAREHDLRKVALEGFFRTLRQQNVPVEAADETLKEIAQTHLKTRTALQKFRPYGNAGTVRERAAEALEEGRLEEAEALLAEVEDLSSENAAAAREAARQAIQDQAKAIALRGNLRRMQLDYEGAVEAWRAAMRVLEPGDPLGLEYLLDIAEAERRAGHFAAAINAADEALSQSVALAAEQRFRGYHAKAKALRDEGRYAEAEQALAAASACLEPSDADRSKRLEIEIEGAGLLVDQGRISEATGAFSRIQEFGMLDESSEQVIARYFHMLGRSFLEKRDWSEASKMLSKALRLREPRLRSGHPDLLRNRADMAFALRHLGRQEEAREYYESCAAQFRTSFGETHPEYVTVLDHLAGIEADLGNLSRARELYEQAVELGRTAYSVIHPDIAQSLNNLGLVLLKMNDLGTASEAFSEAVAMFEEVLGEEHPDTATAWQNLAEVKLSLGELESAERLCRRALEVRREVFFEGHPVTGESWALTARIRACQGGIGQAVESQLRALSAWDQAGSEADIARAEADLARLYLSNNDLVNAKSTARRALFLARRLATPDDGILALALNNAGHVAYTIGHKRRALSLCEAGLAVWRSSRASTGADLMTALMNVSAVAQALGENGRAQALCEEAVSLGDRIWPGGHRLTAIALNNLAAMRRKGPGEETVEALYTRALAILEDACGTTDVVTQQISERARDWRDRQRRKKSADSWLDC